MSADERTLQVVGAVPRLASHERTAIDPTLAGLFGRAGRYRLIRKLGEGGMAEAFAAEVVGVDGFARTVAIKRTLPIHAADPDYERAFTNEAKIAARISHPNVVQVVDLDRDADGRLFMAMEFVDGCDLDRLCDGPRLPWPVVVHVIASVLRGLTAAHELRSDNGRLLLVVHRDVSPHNVFLSKDGAVKLGDWGIAKRAAITSVAAVGTKEGTIKGKFGYMSPEHARGEPLDGRADLYAVGVVLWQMLTGQPFLPGGTTEEMMAWILHRPVPRPSSVAPDVPADLEAVAMTLLERDRDDRFHDARAAITAIEACEAAQVGAVDLLARLVRARVAGERATSDTITVAPRAALAGPASRHRGRSRARRALPLALGLLVVAGGVAAAISLGGNDDAPSAASIAPAAAIDAGTTIPVDASPIDAPLVDAPALPVDAGDDAATPSRRRPSGGGSGSAEVRSYDLGGGD